jgi:hypothetical protein
MSNIILTHNFPVLGIPALRPVIEHLFLSNSTGTSDLKELETLREVILTMLLRLAEYPQVCVF